MLHVVRVAQAVIVPFEVGRTCIFDVLGKTVELVHQSLRGEALTVHEVAIGRRERAVRHGTEARTVIEDRHEIAALQKALAAFGIRDEFVEALVKVIAVERLSDVEDLRRVLFVGDQAAEVAHRLEPFPLVARQSDGRDLKILNVGLVVHAWMNT